jgi:phosphatidylserine/phosphatidylglycerophosphate/cardiolipin synthase-like enzyme
VRDLRTMGFNAESVRTAGHPMVLAHHPGTGGSGAPRVLYYGHYDVQPADPLELWHSPPFEPQIVDGIHGKRIVARGAVDDKGQVMMIVEALRAWHAVAGGPPCPVTLMIEGEEESGSASLEPFMNEHRKALACDVAVVSDTTHSWLERLVMGTNRNRLLRRLARADRHGRLRVFHPVVEGPDGPCPILVHAKLIVADDRYLWIGSSNLNNRSVGLDSEFDVALEAERDDQFAAVAGLRNALLAEHLGAAPEQVAAHLAATGSLVATIERLNGGPRRLRLFKAPRRAGPTAPIPGTPLLDPVEPFSWARLWSKLRG